MQIKYFIEHYNKGKGCSRHSISENKVREIVFDSIKRHMEQVVELDQVLQMIDSMKVKCEDIIANDRGILMKCEELNQCRRMEVSLHKDLLEGIISKEEYIQFSRIYSDRAVAAEQAVEKLKQEVETIFCKGLVSNEWVRKFAHDRDIEELDRSTVLSLVDKIVVHEGCRIEIIFKYEDEYRTACRIVESLPNAEGGGA